METRESKSKNHSLSFLFSSLFLFDIFLLLFGILFLFESRNIRRGFQQVLDARIYPRVVASVFSLMILFHLVRITLDRDINKKRSEKNKLTKEIVFKIGVLFVLFISYILFIQYLGYFESGFLFLWFSMTVLGERSWKWSFKAFFISLLIILVTYCIFGVLLNIYVPSGVIVR